MSSLSDFLYDHNVYDEFVHNCRSHAHSGNGADLPDEDHAVVDFMHMDEGCEAINFAFNWSGTNEGHRFWSDLNETYQGVYEDNGETRDYNIKLDF